MEEISLERITDALKKNIKYIILASIIAIIVGILYSSFAIKKLYKAKVTIIALELTPIEEYAKKIKSEEILKTVAEEYNIPIKELTKNTSLDLSALKTATITIGEKNESAEKSAEIANAIANSFINYLSINYYYNNAKIVKPAEVPSDFYNYNNSIIINNSIKFMIFVDAIYLIIIFSIEFFSDKLKTQVFVEKHLKIKVLGTISNKKTDKNHLNMQYKNITNRILNLDSNKKCFLFQNDKIDSESIEIIMNELKKQNKKISFLNLNSQIKIDGITNIYQMENSQIFENLRTSQNNNDYVIVLSDLFNGTNYDETLLNLFDNIITFVKKDETNISELKENIRILDQYKKLGKNYIVIVN